MLALEVIALEVWAITGYNCRPFFKTNLLILDLDDVPGLWVTSERLNKDIGGLATLSA